MANDDFYILNAEEEQAQRAQRRTERSDTNLADRLPERSSFVDRRQQGTLGRLGTYAWETAKQIFNRPVFEPGDYEYFMRGATPPEEFRQKASAATQQLGKGTRGAQPLDIPNTNIGPAPISAFEWADKYEQYSPYSLYGHPDLDVGYPDQGIPGGTFRQFAPYQEAQRGATETLPEAIQPSPQSKPRTRPQPWHRTPQGG